MRPLEPELTRRKQQHLYRSRRQSQGVQGVQQQIDGREMLNFSSNDYLGLAAHPEVIEALRNGAREYGVGSGSAHLVCGHSQAHHALEEELAEFLSRDRALLFSTGYMANQGVMTALLGRGDSVFQDRLNHASLVDGALLSRADFKRYRHADVASLERQLDASRSGVRLVVTDGVFSMDGDLAPLTEMSRLCAGRDAWLMVDDAHGIGVLGEHGEGCQAHFGLDQQQLPVLMGTLGKSLGTFGAFVSGSEAMIETLIQQARSYIFTTALPPALAQATRVSLRLLREESWRREKLKRLIERFRRGAEQLALPLMSSSTPIQPLLAGSSEQALAWSRQLESLGILISAIRPPTVPQGSARLRITFSAGHTEAHVDRLLEALGGLKPLESG